MMASIQEKKRVKERMSLQNRERNNWQKLEITKK